MPGLRAITHGAIETNAVSQMCIIPSCRQFSSLPNSAIPSSTSTPTWLKSIVLVLGGFAIGRSYTNQQNEERQHEKFPALSALVDFLRPLEASAQASASSSILYEPPNKRVGGTSTPLAGCLSPYFISDAAAKAAPAVVNILVQQDGVISGVGSRGSGFIVSSDGSVLTNAHVVIDALGGSSNGNSRRGWGRQQQQHHHHFPANKQGSTNKTNVSNSTNPSTNKFIAVTLQDGRTFEAEVINYDTVSDLAVLKLKEVNEPLPVAKLGVSAGLRVGEWVVALGSPLHLQNSVSAGIISCVERKASELGLTGARAEYIQTDASINRGSSGGPLVNLAGEVVGVSSMKALAADGVSFAIPIDSVREVVRQLEVYGRMIRPYIGVKLLQLNRYTASQLRKKDSHFPFVVAGVLVPQVASGSPAEKAGLKAGDIIVRYDGSGKEVTTSGFIKALEQHIGEELSIEVVRPDGKGDGGGRTINLKIVAEEATGHRVENGINR
jgi:HtrA serine peptidase 2